MYAYGVQQPKVIDILRKQKIPSQRLVHVENKRLCVAVVVVVVIVVCGFCFHLTNTKHAFYLVHKMNKKNYN